jgi:hypothetical protein
MLKNNMWFDMTRITENEESMLVDPFRSKVSDFATHLKVKVVPGMFDKVS